MQLNNRLKQIVEIVRKDQPITGEQIASKLSVTRATLRPDLAILTMSGILGARPKFGYFYIGMDENVLISRKIKEKNVEEIKSLPIMVSEQTSVYDTIVTMFLEDVGTIIVSQKGYLSGIVSRKDLLKSVIGGGDINKIPVGIIMTRMPNVVFIEPFDEVITAAKKIIEHEIDCLPVVNKEVIEDKEYYKVVGRVTKTNITKLFVELSGE
ncbi:helix-turn-helix transcriptional regulator [Mycoplasmatota bacterium]|nr:helix-turn-helix transcriptional regulator [Mycoplasmatota bacterium]